MISDRFDIQAAIPAGTPAYTPQQLQDAAAPQLQAMLRSLLEDRFKVVLHRDKREMRVYELSLAPEAVKFSASDPDKPKCQTMRLDPDENRQIVVHV